MLSNISGSSAWWEPSGWAGSWIGRRFRQSHRPNGQLRHEEFVDPIVLGLGRAMVTISEGVTIAGYSPYNPADGDNGIPYIYIYIYLSMRLFIYTYIHIQMHMHMHIFWVPGVQGFAMYLGFWVPDLWLLSKRWRSTTPTNEPVESKRWR